MTTSTPVSQLKYPVSYNAYGIKPSEESEKPTVNVGINGVTGRIGKAFFRQWAITELGAMPGVVRITTGNLLRRAKEAPVKLNVVAVNTGKKMSPEALEESMKHDSVFGDYPGYLKAKREDNGSLYLYVGNPNAIRRIRVLEQRDLPGIPWNPPGTTDAEKVEIAVDTTGAFKTKEDTKDGKPGLINHLNNGVQKAIVSAPPKEETGANGVDNTMKTIVYGINHGVLRPEDNIMSNASCTTTAAATITKVIDDAFGIEKGFIQTTHSATATQFVQDKAPSVKEAKSPSERRSMIDSIIPATTGAAKAIGKVIPALNGKLNGLAARVPTSDTSMVYLVFQTKEATTKDEVKKALAEASQSGQYRDLLAKANSNASSKDMTGRHENAIYVEDQIQVIDNNMVVIPAFYDNEWGYTRSLMDLTRLAGKQLKDQQAGGQFNVSA